MTLINAGEAQIAAAVERKRAYFRAMDEDSRARVLESSREYHREHPGRCWHGLGRGLGSVVHRPALWGEDSLPSTPLCIVASIGVSPSHDAPITRAFDFAIGDDDGEPLVIEHRVT